MSKVIGMLQEIAKQARIAQTLCSRAETKQVCIEIRLAAELAIAGERGPQFTAEVPAAPANGEGALRPTSPQPSPPFHGGEGEGTGVPPLFGNLPIRTFRRRRTTVFRSRGAPAIRQRRTKGSGTLPPDRAPGRTGAEGGRTAP